MHKHTHCVLKITHRQLGRAEEERKAPTGALRVPPPPFPLPTREQEREEVQQAGPHSSRPHPAPGVLQLILDLSNRCFTNTDFLSAKNCTRWADSDFCTAITC
ncbi:hypothetical protein ABVT39_020763 [Epinephelus coioides]